MKIGRDIIDLVMGEQVYALRDDHTLYRYIQDDLEKVAEDVSQTQEGSHGLYVISGKDELNIDFYKNGKAEPIRIEENIDRFAPAAQSVNYNMPLNKDQLSALEQLHHDAAILISLSTDQPNLINSLWESTLIALHNYSPADYTREITDLFMYYFIGFSNLEEYDPDDPATEEYLYNGVSQLMVAEDMYAAYTSLNY